MTCASSCLPRVRRPIIALIDDSFRAGNRRLIAYLLTPDIGRLLCFAPPRDIKTPHFPSQFPELAPDLPEKCGKLSTDEYKYMLETRQMHRASGEYPDWANGGFPDWASDQVA